MSKRDGQRRREPKFKILTLVNSFHDLIPLIQKTIEILKKNFENRSVFRNQFNSSSKDNDEEAIEFVEL